MERQKIRIFLVGGEKVDIVKSFTHTYVVRFVSGQEQEVHKSYVKSYYPYKTSRIDKPKKPSKNNQTSFEF